MFEATERKLGAKNTEQKTEQDVDFHIFCLIGELSSASSSVLHQEEFFMTSRSAISLLCPETKISTDLLEMWPENVTARYLSSV